GIAPIATYLEKGLKVLIGTDGASSNNNLNLFEELHLAALLGRLPNGEAPLLTSYQVLQMATTTAANTFNLKSGTLQAGYDADLILVNTKKAHLSPLNDPFSALVYSAQGSDVEYLFSRGEILLEKGQPTKIHHDTALSAIQDVWADIKTR
ncbi:MAG: amidohydrolase family protein, partial [Sphaerochaeta sp.]